MSSQQRLSFPQAHYNPQAHAQHPVTAHHGSQYPPHPHAQHPGTPHHGSQYPPCPGTPHHGSQYPPHPHAQGTPHPPHPHAQHLGTPLVFAHSFVPIPGATQHKRLRRRYDEIERMYVCGWEGCKKAYGTLNHLNQHAKSQGHGVKRTPDEFKEIRKEWKARKKEEEAQQSSRRSARKA
ncbi:hypothetical protein FPQ18DRAFT_327880 [Pyronema domesticum]|nr:hypothetical protein FPQ18DRAFT_327880 [Pyronema domesticum]